ncbi:MAG TPA: glycerophosphodiester phosphodiesterase [Casimicrobiaceae bacterium]
MRAVRVVAHRGSSSAHPDNTWPAFEGAVAEGADAIECDVQATRDGVLVIRHDFTLGNRLVVDLSAAELEAAQPSVIRLADLFDWAKHTNVELLVEVKEPDAALAVSAMVSASAARDRIVVGGFHGPALAAVKASQRAIRTSFMIGSVIAAEEILHVAAVYRVDGVHLCWEGRAPRPHDLLEAALIERLRRADLTTTLWHEEREDELRALVALEPDAICTNTPGVLRRIVDKHHARRVAIIEP